MAITGTTILAAIPLKSILMSQHLPEMPAECQPIQIWLPLTVLTLCRHCADLSYSCLCQWWCHRECCVPCDTNLKAKYQELYWHHCYVGMLLRTLSMPTFCPTVALSSISRTPRNATLCKPLYEFSNYFAFNSENWMSFHCHRHDF